jgi:phospholipid transport system substrate-binding protein
LTRHRLPEIESLHYQRVNLRRLLLALAAATAMLGVKAAIAASIPGPGEAVVRRAIESMKQLADSRDSAEQRKILDTIDRSLAVDVLAKSALGPQWDRLDRTERAKFVALFTQALEKLAYPRAAQALKALDVSYKGEETKPSGHLVRTVIARADGGKIQVNYLVGEEAGRWRINDVELDGESLSRAVTARIQSALKQDGYSKLVADLRKRVAQADSAAAAK